MESWVIALLAAGVVWILYHRRRQATMFRTLARQGRVTQGKVLRRFRRRPPKGTGMAMVEYEFETTNGERCTGRARISGAEYLQTEPGSLIPVIYDAHRPSLNRPQSYLARKGYMQL